MRHPFRVNLTFHGRSLTSKAFTGCSVRRSSTLFRAAAPLSLPEFAGCEPRFDPERVNEFETPGVVRSASKRASSRVMVFPFSAD